MPTINYTGADIEVQTKNGAEIVSLAADGDSFSDTLSTAINMNMFRGSDQLIGGIKVRLFDKNGSQVHQKVIAGQTGNYAGITLKWLYSAVIRLVPAASTSAGAEVENDSQYSITYNVGTDLFDTAGGYMELQFAGHTPDDTTVSMNLSGSDSNSPAALSLRGRGNGVMRIKLNFTVSA